MVYYSYSDVGCVGMRFGFSYLIYHQAASLITIMNKTAL